MNASLTFSSWYHTHPVFAWLILVSAGFLLLGSIVMAIRAAIASDRLQRTVEQARAERRREEKESLRQAWRTIREGEEWEVDVSELRTAVKKKEFFSKVEGRLEYERNKVAYPGTLATLAIIIGTLALFFPLTSTVLWVAGICSFFIVVALIWWIVWWIRYRSLKRRLLRLARQVSEAPTL